MKDMSRARNRTAATIRNSGASVASQLVLIGLNFVSRSVFVSQLGIEYLGLHTLFLSILAIVSLAELGLGAALAHQLYRPLAINHEEGVRDLVGYAGKIYRMLSLAVATIGVALVPLLPHLAGASAPMPHMSEFFLVLVADTALTYALAHRSVLLTADQRLYVLRLYFTAFQLVRIGAQIVALIYLHDYLLFIGLQVIATLGFNVFVWFRTRDYYPYLRERPKALSREKRTDIRSSVGATLIYRVGGTILNQTDALLISALFGLLAVGKYANYMLIVGAVLTLSELMVQGAVASVGQLHADRDSSRLTAVFEEVHLLCLWLYGLGAIVFALALDDAVGLWLGASFRLEPAVSLALALNFYLYGVMSSVGVYRNATGLFRQTRYVFLVTAALNLILSVALGHVYGIAGVLVATAIARCATQLWFEPMKLFKEHLTASSGRFFAPLALTTALAGFTLLVAHWLSLGMSPNTAVGVGAKTLVGAGLFTVLYVVMFRRQPAASSLLARIAHLRSGWVR